MGFRPLSWMPPSAATFVYTTLLRPRPLRLLAQWVVKRWIPPRLEVDGVRLVLNRDDAIVSGALALGCYEGGPRRLFAAILEPGMTVVDVGANIGLYTAIAGRIVGPRGRVVAVEPEAVNCGFIRETAALNGLDHVVVVEAAASDAAGRGALFLNELNKADHRIYDRSGDRPSVEVELLRLDDLVERLGLDRVHVIKMDVQGAEAMALDGMVRTLSDHPGIRLMMEFWPWGIRQAGRDPGRVLAELRRLGFEVFEVGDTGCAFRDPGRDAELAGRTLERQHANLLLQRDRTPPRF